MARSGSRPASRICARDGAAASRGGQLRLVDGPHDAEVRVERVDAVLTRRVVALRAHVGDGRVVAERAEPVAEALADVYRAPLDVVELHAFPAAECRGSDPEVDDDVEHGASGAGDVLRLARRDVGEVDAPHDPPRGHRQVALRQPQRVPDLGREMVEPVELQEQPTGIAMLCRGDLPGAGDRQLTEFHGLAGHSHKLVVSEDLAGRARERERELPVQRDQIGADLADLIEARELTRVASLA